MSEEPPADRLYCRNCGAELDAGRAYCTQCGQPQDRPAGQDRPTGQGQPSERGGPPPGSRGQPRSAGPQTRPPAGDGHDEGRSMLVWALIGIAVLVVAIPVIVVLAAVLASFVLGLGDSAELTPQVSFEYEYSEDGSELTVVVVGGDAFDPDQVTLEGTGFDGAGTTWAQQAGTEAFVTDGDQVTLTGVEDDFELEIVWQSAESGDRHILAQEGPGAQSP